jgi:glycosyltransferase involved in cell wall biosynthesis
VDVFIRAAAEVRRTHPQALFLVVGENHDPAHFEELQKLVQELDLSHNVQFYGSSERVPELLAASEVFCLPSRSEGFSNSLIEAMAAKLPCVATDVGGNSEAIEDGTNGYVVPSEDPATLAERISRLLSNRPLAAKLGDHAAETVRARFSHKAMMDNLVGIYDRLLTESHR